MKYIDDESKEWNDKTKFELMKPVYADKWHLLFDIAKLGDLNKPLTPVILSNPYHCITKHLLYIYSMESFVYADLNIASRDKDRSKIQYYGAFAAALSYIINFANGNRKS